MTKSEQVNADVAALLKARNTLLWVSTREETRVERALVEASASAGYEPVYWDCVQGLTAPDGSVIDDLQPDTIGKLFPVIQRDTSRRVYILRDIHKWFDGATLRALRNLAKSLQSAPRAEARSMIVLTPSSEVPPELAGHTIVLDYPVPDRQEIGQILDNVLSALPEDIRPNVVNGSREAAIDAAVGLSAEEAASCYAKSLVTTRKIDAQAVAAEKKRVISREKVLEWIDPDPRGLDAVGGLENLKLWLQTRKAALSKQARDYGLPAPKGVLLVGVPGCGKSLTAKAVATAWQVSLIRLDMGALKSKWVGDSEANIRRALATAEAVSPCILWLDEIEKAIDTAGGSADGNVSKDQLGALLSWLQERKASVFVVATANDVAALPPELLRKGRFDDLFFVDLPTRVERAAVVRAAMRQHGREANSIDAAQVSEATDGFSGAEIAALVPDALFAAFNDGAREPNTDDLLEAARSVVPLSKTAPDKILSIRNWAKGRARLASKPEAVAAGNVRQIDL